MSKNQRHGGKSGHHDHDSHHSGHKSKLLVGTNGDNVLVGTGRKDVILGRNGDDSIDGGAGNDWLFGGKGNDLLFGGAGNDWLFGGKGNDLLDGGAGCDIILAGKGNDTADYILSVNVGANDFYDGGKGLDTLRLTLTTAEARLAEEDIAAFKAFLEDGCNVFHFESFGLTVRNFEKLEIVTIGGNTAPVAADDAAGTDEDTPVVVDVLANDSDAEVGVLSVTLDIGPAHGSVVLNPDSSFTYTPILNFNGSDSFTYEVTDSEGESDVATVNLTINAVNDAPVADADSGGTNEDAVATGNVLFNDSDVEDNGALVVGTVNGSAANVGTPIALASGALLTVSANGAYNYDPRGHFDYLDDGEVGLDSFDYTAKDPQGAQSGSAAVNFVVQGLNDAPLAVADSYSLDAGTALTVVEAEGVLANDSDPDFEALLATLVNDPKNGDVTLNADGSFVYTPDAGFIGTDSFTYKANDGSDDSNEAIVTLSVNRVNTPPVANPDVIIGAGSAGGTIHVAVIGGAVNFAAEVVTQLEDSKAFNIDASVISVGADWATALVGYDVAVIGEHGLFSEYNSAPQMFAALRDFIDAGHGVVSTGWYAGKIGTYTNAQANIDSDYVSPAAYFGSSIYVDRGATITVDPQLPVHPVTSGVTSYAAKGLLHELAGAIDTSGGFRGKVVELAHDDAERPAIVSAEDVGAGGIARTVFLGSLHMAGPDYSPAETHSGAPDKIFEQAVAWATGEAATDEDTARFIDINALLANDTDPDGDSFTFALIGSTSKEGAALSIVNGGVIYNPSGVLNFLEAGQLFDDSFDYMLTDSQGGTGTGTVKLKVLGLEDPVVPAAVSTVASFEADFSYALDQPLSSVTPDADTLL